MQQPQSCQGVIQHDFFGDICHLRVQLDQPLRVSESETTCLGIAGNGKYVENIRNCDIFVEDYNFFFYVDVRLFEFKSSRQLDIKDMKQLVIRYNSPQRCYYLELPCLPQSIDQLDPDQVPPEKGQLDRNSAVERIKIGERGMDLWKLKRITDHCRLKIDDHTELVKFIANFDYGFAGKSKGKIRCGESDIMYITRVSEPYLNSPLQRRIDREIDELRDFSREQYKLNFVELQVPEGHENPMKFHINFNDVTLTNDENCQLHNLTRLKDHEYMPSVYDQSEVDCGLISILLAICYDVRSTSGEPTCESDWTRSILSAVLIYFEPFQSLRGVVVSFLRRSIIYPLYRNYDFGIMCVQDAINALQSNSKWIVKQLLITHQLFLTSNCSREALNRYYIEDYIRYVTEDTRCSEAHLQMLAHNLKNALLDVNKKQLKLDLYDIEKELLKELVEDIHLQDATSSGSSMESDSNDSDEDDGEDIDLDDGSESGEDELSSASDAEESSVIEQRFDALKI